MDPEIRYARTTDGLSIAYYALGSGPPLIVLSPNIAHAIEREWNITTMRSVAELSARTFTYVRYDPRGAGLSDRYDGRYTVEALTTDLAAVADAVSPSQPVSLYGVGHHGPVAIAYAAAHPERVRNLVLWSTAATGREMDIEPTRRARQLAGVDWRLAVELQAQAVDSFQNADVARQFADMMHASDPAIFVRYEEDFAAWDVTDLLGSVHAPTLVIHPRSSRYYLIANAQRLAAGIPDSQLRLIDTSSVLDSGGRELALITRAFLLGRDRAPGGAAQGTLVVLFADIAGSTALTESLGDAAFRERSAALDGRLRRAIERANGRTVEGRTLGDGVLATFRSARDALDAARRCVALGTEAELPLHVGLHAGDVIREDGNVYGGAVNIAARICDTSAPGEILVSQTVRDLARTSAGVAFEDRGERELKGIADPVRVYAVRQEGD